MISDTIIQLEALRLRKELELSESEPISDMRGVINDLQYQYREDILPSCFSAESKMDKNGEYCITFNKNHLWSEKYLNFTLGHELGHWTIPTHFEMLQGQKLHRSKPEYSSDDEIEREADKFAINFLAPPDSFKKEMAYRPFNPDTITHLSEHFNISTYAALLHFIQHTDLSCTMIVCNQDGQIEYERRSDLMKASYKMKFLYKKAVPETTYTFESISNGMEYANKSILLKDWFSDFPYDMKAEESVINLGYNGKFLALVTPEYSDLNEYVEENDKY